LKLKNEDEDQIPIESKPIKNNFYYRLQDKKHVREKKNNKYVEPITNRQFFSLMNEHFYKSDIGKEFVNSK